jgi:hypothetical protein
MEINSAKIVNGILIIEVPIDEIVGRLLKEIKPPAVINPPKDLSNLRKKSIECIKEIDKFFGPVEIPRTNIHLKNIFHKHFISDPTAFLREMEKRNIIIMKRVPNDQRQRIQSIKITL